MTLKKIADLPKICRHPEHNPPTMIVLSPGVYEHTCPGCGHQITFTIREKSSCEAPTSLARYQDIALRIWNLFPNDPLPSDDPAHLWHERIEALLNRDLLIPRTRMQQLEARNKKLEEDLDTANILIESIIQEANRWRTRK
jgi:hypothetical protein